MEKLQWDGFEMLPEWNLCIHAAEAGHWDIVRLSIEHGCPDPSSIWSDMFNRRRDLDDYFCRYAVEQDRWDIVKLAVEHGFSCPKDIRDRIPLTN